MAARKLYSLTAAWQRFRDTCCIFDLMKATPLEEMLALPYTFIMPGPLFDDEWLSVGNDEKGAAARVAVEPFDEKEINDDVIRRGQREPAEAHLLDLPVLQVWNPSSRDVNDG